MKLGRHEIGGGRTYVIAECGLNANGSVDLAERLIDAAAAAGADAVKFQRRSVETFYSKPPFFPGYLDQPREHPLSEDQTQRGQKLALEFDEAAYRHLAAYAEDLALDFSASCWDVDALNDIVEWVSPPWLKVASASLTDYGLLWAYGATGLPLIVSVGMASLAEIDDAVRTLVYQQTKWEVRSGKTAGGLALLHCCSAYPAENEELNLTAIPKLAERYRTIPIGWSGHERGLATSVAAVVLGACIVERHITLDRTMYGSDQIASIEPEGFRRLVRDIRAVEAAMGDGEKRCMPSEEPVRAKLRGA